MTPETPNLFALANQEMARIGREIERHRRQVEHAWFEEKTRALIPNGPKALEDLLMVALARGYQYKRTLFPTGQLVLSVHKGGETLASVVVENMSWRSLEKSVKAG